MTDSIIELLDYSLRTAGKISRSAGTSLAYIEIASVYLEYGQKSRCLDILASALRILERLKYPAEKAKMLAWTARLYSAAGEKVKSLDQFTRAALLARASETTGQKYDALYRIVCEYADAGLNDEAAGLLPELHALATAPENEVDTAAELINIAEIYIQIGRVEKENEILLEALTVTDGLKDKWFKSERWSEIAETYVSNGQNDCALPVLEKLLSAASEIDPISRPQFLLKAADLYLTLGNKTRALQILTEALPEDNPDEPPQFKARTLIEIAELHAKSGDPQAANSLLSRASEIVSSLEDIKDRISIFIDISRETWVIGQKERALSLADQALSACRLIQDTKALLYLQGNLSVLLIELDARKKSEKIISGMINIVREANTRTSGLGAIAADLAESGEFISALRLAQLITEPEVKAGALNRIASNLVGSDKAPNEETIRMIREVTATA